MEVSLDKLTKHYKSKIAVDCVSATMTPGVYGLWEQTVQAKPL